MQVNDVDFCTSTGEICWRLSLPCCEQMRCRDCSSTSSMTRQAPRRIQLCVTALLVLALYEAECKRFLGVAAIGSRSHQFCMLRVGQELASRGHHFTFLVNDQEGMGLKYLGARAFPGLEVVEFLGLLI